MFTKKKNRDIQRIKEVKLSVNYQSLTLDIRKSTQAIFLAEVLYKLLHEEESNTQLFDFIENSLQYFDLMHSGAGNFHLFFLGKLTKYLGVLPHIPASSHSVWFDFTKGTISNTRPEHPKYMDPEQTRIFSDLIESGIEDLQKFKINQKMRRDLLPKIIEFYRHHYESMGELKSVSVLKEIFD